MPNNVSGKTLFNPINQDADNCKGDRTSKQVVDRLEVSVKLEEVKLVMS